MTLARWRFTPSTKQSHAVLADQAARGGRLIEGNRRGLASVEGKALARRCPLKPVAFRPQPFQPSFPVYPGVYQSAIGILQNEHPCGLQPDFGEQVQNIE